MDLAKEVKHFHIYDYFLNGRFLKWEEVHESHLPVNGEMREIRANNGQSIAAKVIGTEQVSESEHRVFLVSAL
jgi:phosphatidylserine decarboxylase